MQERGILQSRGLSEHARPLSTFSQQQSFESLFGRSTVHKQSQQTLPLWLSTKEPLSTFSQQQSFESLFGRSFVHKQSQQTLPLWFSTKEPIPFLSSSIADRNRIQGLRTKDLQLARQSTRGRE